MTVDDCGFDLVPHTDPLRQPCRDMFCEFLRRHGLAEWRLALTAHNEPMRTVSVYSEWPTGTGRLTREFPRDEIVVDVIRDMLERHYCDYVRFFGRFG